MGDPVAQLEGVDKVYGSGQMAVKALDGVDLTVNRGDYLAVMGASGSGKSTAMNILGCLDRPSSGSYRLRSVATATASCCSLLLAQRSPAATSSTGCIPSWAAG